MGQEKQLKPKELQAAAKELGVTTPIMAHRVVGGRVELRLLGGAVVEGPVPGQVARPPEDLNELSYDDLYQLAQEYKIRGRSSMTADELKDALAPLYASTTIAVTLDSTPAEGNILDEH